MSDAAQSKESSSRIKAFFLVVLVFAVLGPAIGGLLYGAIVAFAVAGANSGAAGAYTVVSGYLLFLLLSVISGYLFGMPHALIAGAIVAAAGIWKQWNNVLVALAAGVIASVAGTFIVLLGQPSAVDTTIVLWSMPSSLVAALVCWFITRSIVRATWTSAEPAR